MIEHHPNLQQWLQLADGLLCNWGVLEHCDRVQGEGSVILEKAI